MNETLIEFKEKLKELKKLLGGILKECDRELIWCENFSAKISVIKMGYDNGLGMVGFNKEEIKNSIPLVQRIIKYEVEIEELKLLLEKCGVVLDKPSVTFRGTKLYGSGSLEVLSIDGLRSIELLKEKESAAKEDDMGDLFEKFIKGDVESAFKLSKIYVDFYAFAAIIEAYLLEINMLVNSIDNDKIKMPINDVGVLYSILIMLNISDDNINKILGMVINFNSCYIRKNSNNRIKDVDLVKNLAEYYNYNGTFKSNLSVEEFDKLLVSIKNGGYNYFEFLKKLYVLLFLINDFNCMNDYDRYDSIFDYMKDSYKQYKVDTTVEVKKGINDLRILNYKNTIDRDFYMYLAEFYDGKSDRIIAIPDDLEDFYQRLENSNLTQIRKKHIRKLMKENVSEFQKKFRLKWLDVKQIEVYKMASELLATFEKFNPDRWELAQILNEVNDILDVVDSGINEQEKTELLEELFNYIEMLSFICEKNVVNTGVVKRLRFNN